MELLLVILRFAVLAGLGVFVARALRLMAADLQGAVASGERPSSAAIPLAPARRSRPRLVVEAGIRGLDPGQAFPVEKEMVIGRSPAAHIVLGDKFVSLRHARLAVDDGTVRVSDLGSSNGTFINDQRVTDTGRLGQGDRLRIGSVVLRLEWPEA